MNLRPHLRPLRSIAGPGMFQTPLGARALQMPRGLQTVANGAPPAEPPPGTPPPMVLTCYPQMQQVPPAASTTTPVEPVSGALAPFTPTTTWRSNLFSPQQLTGTGQVATANDTWATLASTLGIAGTAAGIYHGYKRHQGSVGWTLLWGLFGGLLPIIAIPWAFAQGFGKPAGR